MKDEKDTEIETPSLKEEKDNKDSKWIVHEVVFNENDENYKATIFINPKALDKIKK